MPKNDSDELERAISCLTRAIEESTQQRKAEFEWCKSHEIIAILKRLETGQENIMSAIKDYSDAVNAKFDSIGTSVDSAVTSIAGVAADVKFLKDTITQMQNNPGPISPEDQALLDAALARATALETKTSALKDSLASLDAETEEPPTPPTT